MTKGRTPKGDRVAVDGPWLPVPLDFLASRACSELSPHAIKMLVLLLGQLGANGYGNGRLDMSRERQQANGWTSVATADAALKELINADLLVRTRQGAKGRLCFYAVSLFPMHCKSEVLEVGPGSWSTADWRGEPNAAQPPTLENRSVWHRPRMSKREASPRHGTASALCSPAAGLYLLAKGHCAPAAGPQTSVGTGNSNPPRDAPSRVAICTPSAAQANPTDRRSNALRAVNIGGAPNVSMEVS